MNTSVLPSGDDKTLSLMLHLSNVRIIENAKRSLSHSSPSFADNDHTLIADRSNRLSRKRNVTYQKNLIAHFAIYD